MELLPNLIFASPEKDHRTRGKALLQQTLNTLQSVYTCLGDLFNFIEEENKRLGYSYARIAEDQKPYKAEFLEGDYSIPSETKLRPLINYDHQTEEHSSTEDATHFLDVTGNGDDIELSA